MYCEKCGNNLEDSNKFCVKCGSPVITEVKPQSTNKTRGFWGSYNLSEEELKFQVEHYKTLPISKSSRGVAVLTIGGLMIFGVLVGLLVSTDGGATLTLYDVVWTAIIYTPLLYFVYRGHSWAIVGLGLLYTVDKFYTVYLLSSGGFNISVVVFWIIGIAPLWAAFRVERERKRKLSVVTS